MLSGSSPQLLSCSSVKGRAGWLSRAEVRGADDLRAGGGALLVLGQVSFVEACRISATFSRPTRLVQLLYLGPRPGALERWLAGNPETRMVAGTDPPRQLLSVLRSARKAMARGGWVFVMSDENLSQELSPRFRTILEKVRRGIESPVVPMASVLPNSGFDPMIWLRKNWVRRALAPLTVIAGRALPPRASIALLLRKLRETEAEAFSLRRRPGETLPGEFLRTARKRLFKMAMVDPGGRPMSFLRLLAGVLALSRELDRRLDPEKHVGLLLPPSSAGALSNVALSMLGRVPINLNYSAGEKLARLCAEKARVKTILSSRRFLEKIGWPEDPGFLYLEDVAAEMGKGTRFRSFLEALLLPAPILRWLYLKKADPAAPGAILFSSGTTGDPKGVVLSHSNILRNIESVNQALHLNRDDRVMGVLPFFHAMGLTFTLWLPLTLGFPAIYQPNPLDASGLGKLLRQHRGTLFVAPPTFLQIYVEKCDERDFRTLRFAVSGAEKMSSALARRFEARFEKRLLEGYGCTELSPVVAVNFCEVGGREGDHWKTGSVGKPLPGIAVRVVDQESREELEENREGILLVKGPSVMVGYLDNPVLTQEVIRDGWYFTGDIARLDPDGFIEITDRLSRFSKIGGEMVPHGKVEVLLSDAVDGVDFAVTSIPDEKKGERLAVVHTRLPDHLTPRTLVEGLRASGIPNLWVPRPDSFLELEELPRTGTGKADLRALRKLAQQKLR